MSKKWMWPWGDKYHLQTMSIDGFISFNQSGVYMLEIWALNGSYNTGFWNEICHQNQNRFSELWRTYSLITDKMPICWNFYISEICFHWAKEIITNLAVLNSSIALIILGNVIIILIVSINIDDRNLGLVRALLGLWRLYKK